MGFEITKKSPSNLELSRLLVDLRPSERSHFTNKDPRRQVGTSEVSGYISEFDD